MPVLEPLTRAATSAVVLTALLTGACTSGRHEALAARVNAVIEPLVAANQFSGAVVLTREGEVVYERGFGMANHAKGLSFTPDTPADGGSLAKTLTAAGIWLLAYEGRIDVDAPVTQYLREYPHAGTTVRHLISHSNGLPPYYEFWDPYFAPGEFRTTQKMLEIVAREIPAPSFPPGSRFEYSNFGFDVAALLIERVTGLTVARFFEERFFSRLGMESSFARPGRFGGPSVYFSVADLSRWASAHASGPAIAPGALAAGQQRSLIDGKPSPITGLGWYCNDSGVRCYHTGSIDAFHGFAYWDVERDESVAFISNASTPPWEVVTLQRNLVAALAGQPVQAAGSAGFDRIDDAMRESLAGTWTAEGAGDLTLSVTKSRLSLRAGSGLEFGMFQVGPDVLYVPGPDYWVAFSGGDMPSDMHVRSIFADFVARRVDSTT